MIKNRVVQKQSQTDLKRSENDQKRFEIDPKQREEKFWKGRFEKSVFWLKHPPSRAARSSMCAHHLGKALHVLTQVSLQPRPFITFALGQLERQSAKGEWLRDEAEAVVSLVKHTV